MVFPLQESHKILYEIRNLPLAIMKERKQGFILFGCGTLQRHTQLPEHSLSSDEKKLHRNRGAFPLPHSEIWHEPQQN